MSVPGLLAAIAILLAIAAMRELLAARSLALPGGVRLDGRAARAVLRLGLPERIRRAGLEARLPLTAAMLAKTAGAIVGGLVGLAAAPAAPGRISLLVAVGLPAAGFVALDALLERRARLRSRRLLAALPDACDLLAVGAATGRGTGAGFAEIAATGEGPLAEALRVSVAELSCGDSLAGVLRSLRARVPGEVASLCAAIERSHRHGSPLAEQLRRHAGALRRDQRRAVEERAARAAPKIQLVVALVLVPSVLLMIVAALAANADVLLAGFR